MRRQPANLLLALGLSCGLIAIVLALLGAPGASVEAAPHRSIGTPTAPPSPTPEPTDPPPTATTLPTSTPTATARPTNQPTATPADPAVTPRPRRKNDPQPTPKPTLNPPTETAVPETRVEVSLHKMVDHDTRTPGQTAMYTLIGRNAGPATAYDVVISDNVPDEVSVIDLSSSKGDVVVRGQTVTAYPSVLAPGEAVTVKITVRVRSNAGPGIVINTGTISTSTHDDPGDNSNSATFTIPSAALTVQRLPHTDETDLPGLFTLPIWLPWALVGGLFVALGALMRLRGGHRASEPAGADTPAISASPTGLSVFQLPSLAPAGPPRLGPPLPPPAPPAPLPPLAPLDRDDALRDAIDEPL